MPSQSGIFNVQEFTDLGDPLVGGRLYTFAYGTTTQKTAYTDAAGLVPHTYTADGLGGEYIALNSRGELPGSLYLAEGSYDLALKTSAGATVWTRRADPQGDLANTLRTDLASNASGKGAEMVGLLGDSVGEAPTNVSAYLNLNVKGMRRSFGLSGDFAEDATAKINLAIQSGKTLEFEEGIYRITPATAKTDEAGTNIAGILMRSGMRIHGHGEKSVLKIADGVSTDGAPLRHSMFFSNEVLSNITIKDMVLDMNGANNPISPGRGGGTYNLFTNAHLIFSGTPGGVAARAYRVHLENNHFINGAGVSCIVMEQSNTVGAELGSDWKLLYNRFKNNGLDTYDHSSVFAWAENCLGIGNIAEADVMYGTVGSTGPQVFWEVAGRNQTLIGNRIDNYYRGHWVAANKTRPVERIMIADSPMRVKAIGVGIFRETADSAPVQNVVLDNLNVTITDDAAADPLKALMQCLPTYQVSGITLRDSTLVKEGAATAACLASIGTQTVAAQAHSDINIVGNSALNVAIGVQITSTAASGLGSIRVRDNKYKEMAAQASYTTKFGVIATGTSTIQSLEVKYNTIENLSTAVDHGTYVTGLFGRVKVDGNTYQGVNARYTEATATITNRDGDEVLRSATSYDAPSLINGASVQVNVTVNGALPGDLSHASLTTNIAGLSIASSVVAADAVTVTITNHTGGTIDAAAGTLNVLVKK